MPFISTVPVWTCYRRPLETQTSRYFSNAVGVAQARERLSARYAAARHGAPIFLSRKIKKPRAIALACRGRRQGEKGQADDQHNRPHASVHSGSLNE
jgi:hypothetical protein